MAPAIRGQASGRDGLPLIEGKICDSSDRPIAGAAVSLDGIEPVHTLVSTSDAQGKFRFDAVPAGTYTLRANQVGYREGREGPFVVHAQEVKSVLLLLAKAQMSGQPKDSSGAVEFADEPTFTVAGVTDTTALGGHGSAQVLPSSNALAKETASLGRQTANQPLAPPNDSASTGTPSEASLRASLAREDRADERAQLAEMEEAAGRPLEAVKDYQRAAELQPTETHLFAWGAELLLHRAFEPAMEVFSKGRRLYPQSSRMLLGLGAARFAQGSKEQAEQDFLEACDLNPADPAPYLFLGRLQATENSEPVAWADRMKRFVSFHPEDAMSHYLYAVALTKQGRNQQNLELAESQLERAIELDPRFGDAYLQIGILRMERKDFPGAIAALEKAIAVTSLPDQAHYRLAQVYRRTGDAEKATREIEQFNQISEEKNKQAERERHEIQQFVYTLRSPSTPSTAPSPDPR
jgi:tetratricopeptide (TPR) repeat protein